MQPSFLVGEKTHSIWVQKCRLPGDSFSSLAGNWQLRHSSWQHLAFPDLESGSGVFSHQACFLTSSLLACKVASYVSFHSLTKPASLPGITGWESAHFSLSMRNERDLTTASWSYFCFFCAVLFFPCLAFEIWSTLSLSPCILWRIRSSVLRILHKSRILMLDSW